MVLTPLRAFVLLAALVTPILVSAQVPESVPGDPSHDEALACSVADDSRGQVWLRVVQSRQLEEDEAKAVLDSMADSLAVEVAQRSDDLALQYELALVLGVRADLGGGREQVRAAEALDRQTEVVFALDPDHPGAQFLSGRLQGAVLRMNGIKRFIATRLFGGERLGDASWEDAQLRLEAAAEGDPCVPDHHYELARLYHDRDEPELAAQQLARFFTVTGSRELFADVLVKGRELEEELADQ